MLWALLERSVVFIDLCASYTARQRVSEVASTAEHVEETSSQADELATRGNASAQDAMAVMEDVGEATHDVAGDVHTLQDWMEAFYTPFFPADLLLNSHSIFCTAILAGS